MPSVLPSAAAVALLLLSGGAIAQTSSIKISGMIDIGVYRDTQKQ